MAMIGTWMFLAPLGFGLLVMSDVLAAGDPLTIIVNEGIFLAEVLGGFAVHTFISLPLIYFLGNLPKLRNPYAHMRAMIPSMVTGLGTSARYAMTFLQAIPAHSPNIDVLKLSIERVRLCWLC